MKILQLRILLLVKKLQIQSGSNFAHVPADGLSRHMQDDGLISS